jgi:flavin reductase (DIM6/NTAB) family NADH-FMN oxidoreductase RutF
MATQDNDLRGRLALALGRIPSGCAILTARHAGRRTGMLASWVQQAAFDPPLISVAVNKARPIARLIDEAGAFVVNLLGEDPAAMFRHFGRGFALEDDAFAGLSVREVDAGVVLPGQVAWLAGRVRQRCDCGDHWLYLAEVVDAGGSEGAAPYVHLRRNGLSY